MISSLFFIIFAIFVLDWNNEKRSAKMFKAKIIDCDLHKGYTVKIKVHGKYIESKLIEIGEPEIFFFTVGTSIDVYCLEGVYSMCYLSKRNFYNKNVIALILGICWFIFSYFKNWIL